ncbi:flagellar protein FlaG [Stomatohabitans albus]|uniref:flagellar protein FlaG n=1 Tax=Stomatohabitans albus TaxID=3110766 RepID=UPI00300C5328
MEPLNGVIPSAFANAVPQSLQILPVPGQEESTTVDLNVDKERKKSQFIRNAQPLLDSEIPPELRVSIHKELRELMVRIVDQYGDTLRELPPEKVLDMVADIVGNARKREEAHREAISEAIDTAIRRGEHHKRGARF